MKRRSRGLPRWHGGHHLMGDVKGGPVRLSFNPQLRVEFHGATVTPDAGLLLPRELGERLGLSALIERHLTDPRTGRNLQFALPDLFRQSISSRLAGYEDTNATAPVQDQRAYSARPGFRPPAGRELLDSNSLSADPRSHRATRMASDVIENPTPGARAMRNGGRSSGGVSEKDSQSDQTHEHGAADGPCVARMTSVNVPEG
jgi:DDE family transposase